MYIHVCLSASMTFGSTDELGSNLASTANSLTLRWQEGNIVNDSRAAPFIGYNILVSTDSVTYTFKQSIIFQMTTDQWQEVTIEGLEPDTQYWFDIAVYRIYSDGRIFQNDDYTAKDQFGLISGSTLHSNHF